MFNRKILIAFRFVAVLVSYLSTSRHIRVGKVIETKSGAVQGKISVSRDGREFYEWLEIPYAKPPIGSLRFASPVPVEKWAGVRDATRYGSQCVQNIFLFKSFRMGNEDCLFLNIHVPKRIHDEKKVVPVLVFIHGGAYILGSSNIYRPEFLMDEDIVFVGLNYRVDIFGFLSTGDKAIRGNMGLKDQTQALRWIKENIHYFGGDANQVTIFGHSAGGASVHQLMLSPMTKGLFHKAISSSGAASNTWGFKSPAKSLEKTKKIAITLGCPIEDTEELANCLRSASVRDLMGTVWKDMNESPLLRPNQFGDPPVPTIEGVDDDDAFLTQHPLEVVSQGKAHRIPWLVGYTADEGLISTSQLYADETMQLEFEDNWEECIKSVFKIDASVNMSSSEKAQRIRDFYLPPSQRSLAPNERMEAHKKLLSDAFFNFDIRESILYQRQFSPVYPYFYNKTDGPTLSEFFRLALSGKSTAIIDVIVYIYKTVRAQSVFGLEPFGKDTGVNHGSEVGLVFSAHPVIQVPRGSKSYGFSKSLVKLLVHFASIPDNSTLQFRGVHFPAASTAGPLKYLEMTNDIPRMISEPYEERMEFLHSLRLRDYNNSK